jgi:transcriptional regulator with XRE-family HTH domain
MKRFLTDTSPKYVAKRLELFRKALGLRQVDLVRELDWSPQKWGQWEKGQRTPNIADMIELAERYGVTLDYVYRGDMSRLPEWMAQKIRELVASDPLINAAPGSDRPGAVSDKVGNGS